VLKTYLLENIVQWSSSFEGSAEERENKVEIVQKSNFSATLAKHFGNPGRSKYFR